MCAGEQNNTWEPKEHLEVYTDLVEQVDAVADVEEGRTTHAPADAAVARSASENASGTYEVLALRGRRLLGTDVRTPNCNAALRSVLMPIKGSGVWLCVYPYL